MRRSEQELKQLAKDLRMFESSLRRKIRDPGAVVTAWDKGLADVLRAAAGEIESTVERAGWQKLKDDVLEDAVEALERRERQLGRAEELER